MSLDNHTASSATDRLPRRRFLQLAGSAAAAVAMGPGNVLAAPKKPQRLFNFAHLADIHLQPEKRGAEGFRKCLAAVHALKPRPELILTGGDLVMDISGAGEARAKVLFDLYTSICKDSDIPIKHCVGNHDVFGWNNKPKTSPDHVWYGKKIVQKYLDLPRTTYSFDHKGWHFCMVDDILPSKDAWFRAGVSDEDLDWLTNDLQAAGDKPKVICAHVPFVSVAVFRTLDSGGNPMIPLRSVTMCGNPKPVLNMCRQNNVTLAIHGHLHQNETIKFQKTTFIGTAAVCGAWWGGPYEGNPEGFSVFDAYSDGTFKHRYHTYGWKAAT